MCTSTRCDQPTTRIPPGYWTAHKRLRRTRGPASTRTCACGNQARDWAYTGPPQPGPYLPHSQNLDDYTALCVSCHRKLDLGGGRG